MSEAATRYCQGCGSQQALHHIHVDQPAPPSLWDIVAADEAVADGHPELLAAGEVPAAGYTRRSTEPTIVARLSDHEQAHARRLLASSDAYPDWMVGREPGLRLAGWRAQVAVASLFGMNLAELAAGPDRGVDLVLPNGSSCQVKLNSYVHGDLYTPYYDPRLHADVAILVRPAAQGSDDFRIGGWIDRASFAERAHALAWQRRPEDGGPGLTPAELRPIGELL